MLTRAAIQERSYVIWEREGRPHGRDLEHWRRAEMELIAELERLHAEAKAFVEAEAAGKTTTKAKSPAGGAKTASTRKRKAKAPAVAVEG
jgi:hypothetical protein